MEQNFRAHKIYHSFAVLFIVFNRQVGLFARVARLIDDRLAPRLFADRIDVPWRETLLIGELQLFARKLILLLLDIRLLKLKFYALRLVC